MSRLIEMFTAFVKDHPVIGGLALVAVGMLMIGDSIESAKEFHELENARELTAQVVSVSEATPFPPRSDVAVSWTEQGSDAESTIRVGPKTAKKLQEGDSVQILVGEPAGRVVLASQRPTERPVELAGLEAMPLVFFGIGMAVIGAIVAMLGKRIEQYW